MQRALVISYAIYYFVNIHPQSIAACFFLLSLILHSLHGMNNDLKIHSVLFCISKSHSYCFIIIFCVSKRRKCISISEKPSNSPMCRQWQFFFSFSTHPHIHTKQSPILLCLSLDLFLLFLIFIIISGLSLKEMKLTTETI